MTDAPIKHSYRTVSQQYAFEVENWTRVVSFYQEETEAYKTRLAEVIGLVADEKSLEEAEHFQEDLIEQDKVIMYLWRELIAQGKLLARRPEGNSELFEQVLLNQSKLRADMSKAEQLFMQLKGSFEKYLATQFEN